MSSIARAACDSVMTSGPTPEYGRPTARCSAGKARAARSKVAVPHVRSSAKERTHRSAVPPWSGTRRLTVTRLVGRAATNRAAQWAGSRMGPLLRMISDCWEVVVIDAPKTRALYAEARWTVTLEAVPYPHNGIISDEVRIRTWGLAASARR